MAVAFVNGWTDAPNAIASCVATRCLKLKTAVVMAACADFFGALIIGLFNGKVAQTVMNIADFGSDNRTVIIALCAAMSSVVIWSTAAWYFGIPTSESHALLSGLSGAGIAVNGGFSGASSGEWLKVFYGLVVSAFVGFASGFLLSKLTVKLFINTDKSKSDLIFENSQIISGVFMSFMHGAQDSQKFAGVLMLIISSLGKSQNKNIEITALILCSAAIALGTSTGGARIIKSVGIDMIRLRKDQGFAADMAGALCLLISTVFGFPVSTTHTKTSAVVGVGTAKSLKSVDWRVVGEMIIAWVLTFPACIVLGWVVTRVFLNLI